MHEIDNSNQLVISEKQKKWRVEGNKLTIFNFFAQSNSEITEEKPHKWSEEIWTLMIRMQIQRREHRVVSLVVIKCMTNLLLSTHSFCFQCLWSPHWWDTTPKEHGSRNLEGKKEVAKGENQFNQNFGKWTATTNWFDSLHWKLVLTGQVKKHFYLWETKEFFDLVSKGKSHVAALVRYNVIGSIPKTKTKG